MQVNKHSGRFPFIAFLLMVFAEVLTLCLEKLVALRASEESSTFYMNILQGPWFWLVLFMSGIQLLLWLRILKSAPLSLAYVVSSVSVPLTMLAACWVFKECLSPHVWIGALLIVSGIFLVAPREVGEPAEEPAL